MNLLLLALGGGWGSEALACSPPVALVDPIVMAPSPDRVASTDAVFVVVGPPRATDVALVPPPTGGVAVAALDGTMWDGNSIVVLAPPSGGWEPGEVHAIEVGGEAVARVQIGHALGPPTTPPTVVRQVVGHETFGSLCDPSEPTGTSLTLCWDGPTPFLVVARGAIRPPASLVEALPDVVRLTAFPTTVVYESEWSDDTLWFATLDDQGHLSEWVRRGVDLPRRHHQVVSEVVDYDGRWEDGKTRLEAACPADPEWAPDEAAQCDDDGCEPVDVADAYQACSTGAAVPWPETILLGLLLLRRRRGPEL